VVLIFMLLVNSPLLNFQSISASNQLSRLHDGKTSYETFDYQYFDRSLGRQGYLELQTLKTELKGSAPEKVAIIDRMYVNHQNVDKEELSIEDFKKFVNYWPSKNEFPEDLIEAVYSEKTLSKWSTYRGNSYYFVAQDLNDDSELDYIVIEENNHSTSADLWFLKDEKWKSKYMQTSNPNDNRLIKDYFLNNKVEVIQPKWKNLKIGDLTFRTSLD